MLCTPTVRARVGSVTAPFATALLGWKPAAKTNKLGWSLVPNFADVDSPKMVRIAAGVLEQLAVPGGTVSDVPKDPGGPLEQQVCDHLGWFLQRHDPERGWRVERGAVITQFDQYAHLSELDRLVRGNPQLRVTVGTDYLIKPDVTVSLAQGSARPGCRRCTPRCPASGRSGRTGCRTSGTSACR